VPHKIHTIEGAVAKLDEVNYIQKVAEVEGIDVTGFNDYLQKKPFSDPHCGLYLSDIAQAFDLLPPPPGRLLDIGVGSGWTSELFARRGYDVLGLDISPDMISLASKRAAPNLAFQVCDYEVGPVPGGFDAAVIYDSLHHADDEYLVIKNVFGALKPGGTFVTIEPGIGHSKSKESIEVMQKYGTTEKDMPYVLQRKLMLKAGFKEVRRYVRRSQIPPINVSGVGGMLVQAYKALRHGAVMAIGGHCIVVAIK
jgi:SAM-dependent methyltransferase